MLELVQAKKGKQTKAQRILTLNLSEGLFGSAYHVLPSLTLSYERPPYALGVAPTECDYCSRVSKQVPLSDPEQGWFHSCCEQECRSCYNHPERYGFDNTICGECDNCSDCCGCVVCSDCGHRGSLNCSGCETCEECSCQCQQEMCEPYLNENYNTPGWVERGLEIPQHSISATHLLKELGAHYFDPVRAMAEYYVLDFIMARQPAKLTAGIGHQYIPSPLTDIIKEANRLQKVVIKEADALFLMYGFVAIGGEVRHHPNVESNPRGRKHFWSDWLALATVSSQRELLQDAKALFDEDRAWSDSFGGEAWSICANIFLSRVKGRLSPKYFVDRCFALQHNGGSFLNKIDWGMSNDYNWSVGHMQHVGDAHAHKNTNLGLLLRLSSQAVRDLYAVYHKEMNLELRATGRPMEVRPTIYPERLYGDYNGETESHNVFHMMNAHV